jgi:hypothetical protein
MSKPLGFYGCNHQHELINDISNIWGDDLSGLTERDRIELIHLTSEHIASHHLAGKPSTNAKDIGNRLNELPLGQLQALIQTLGNK